MDLEQWDRWNPLGLCCSPGELDSSPMCRLPWVASNGEQYRCRCSGCWLKDYQPRVNKKRQIKLLVEIGPEGWTPTQQPPELTPFLRSLLRGSYFNFYLSEERRHRNLQRQNKKILCKPKTEELAKAFGALFSLQGTRSITRGSLFIGGPWV
jgi:hypothetical protein